MAINDDSEKEKSKAEYLIMLEAFKRMIYLANNEDETWDALEEIMELRSDALINRVLVGMNLSMSDARSLLNKGNEHLSSREREERDILLAAWDNLVDFAVAEEFQMMSNLPEIEDDLGDIEEYEDVFSRYNETYAYQENKEVLYAAGIAYWWVGVPNERIITFMTQRDERVRDSHAILEGESYPKSQFPQELIPPIEFGCRCFLIDEGYTVQASSRGKEFLPLVSPIFRESLAKKGRIFTDKHPYFDIALKHKKRLQSIKERIKSKYYVNYINP